MVCLIFPQFYRIGKNELHGKFFPAKNNYSGFFAYGNEYLNVCSQINWFIVIVCPRRKFSNNWKVIFLILKLKFCWASKKCWVVQEISSDDQKILLIFIDVIPDSKATHIFLFNPLSCSSLNCFIQEHKSLWRANKPKRKIS